MVFEKQKEAALLRLAQNDKSRSGKLDDQVQDLVRTINSHPDLYTTSSCAGRILLYEKKEGSKKNETKWLLISHGMVQIQNVKDAVKNSVEDVWFSVEPVILHVTARNEASAKKMIHLAQQAGLKRGGAITLKPRIVLELEGVDEMSTIISKEGNLVIDDAYLSLLVEEAKKKLGKNAQRINALLKTLRNL